MGVFPSISSSFQHATRPGSIISGISVASTDQKLGSWASTTPSRLAGGISAEGRPLQGRGQDRQVILVDDPIAIQIGRLASTCPKPPGIDAAQPWYCPGRGRRDPSPIAPGNGAPHRQSGSAQSREPGRYGRGNRQAADVPLKESVQSAAWGRGCPIRQVQQCPSPNLTSVCSRALRSTGATRSSSGRLNCRTYRVSLVSRPTAMTSAYVPATAWNLLIT